MTVQLHPSSWQYVGLLLRCTNLGFVKSLKSAALWMACKDAYIQNPPQGKPSEGCICNGLINVEPGRPVRCVQLTANHCRLRLTWSRQHALWTPQQWSCVMFSDESRFSLQSDSRRILIWRAPDTRYHQENTFERHRYGGAGWLVWGGSILASRTDLHVQSVTMTGHIYRDFILKQQYVCFVRHGC
ncbi:transposable element Tcb1 transposase [Trichonephila clavipes]|nr:transposable element Tcb1 transposase [Trichonephila clavipes]